MTASEEIQEKQIRYMMSRDLKSWEEEIGIKMVNIKDISLLPDSLEKKSYLLALMKFDVSKWEEAVLLLEDTNFKAETLKLINFIKANILEKKENVKKDGEKK